MNTVFHVRWAIATLLVLITSPAALRSQVHVDEKVFAPIPEESRARLIERLTLYVATQRAADYDKLYDLYSERTINQVFKGQNKTEFSAAFRQGDAERKSIRLFEFTPKKIEKKAEDGSDFYKIYGKAVLLQQGEIVKRKIVIEAHPQNGTWYFSAVAIVQKDYAEPHQPL